MSAGFDLGSYLQQVRSEGRQDSEGSFTIAQDKALDKLAHFALPGEYDWVLKVVQAANAWLCPTLRITQTRVATSFYFRPPDARFPSDSAIVNALRHGSLEAGDPIHELCIALRALVDQAKLSFVLATRYGGELGEPIYSGDDVSALDDRTRKQWSHLERDGLRLTVSHFRGSESFTGRYIPTFSRIAKRNLEIAAILDKRAFCSRTTIYLDGREVTNPFRCATMGATLYYRPLVIGILKEEEEIDWRGYPVLSDAESYRRPPELACPATSWCLIRTFEWMSVQDYRDAMSRSTGAFSLDYYRTTQHQVFWLRFGVICYRQTIFNATVATTAFLILEGSHLRTDLAGLTLGMEQDGVDQANLLQASIVTTLDKVVEELPHLARKVAVDGKLAVQQNDRDDSPMKLDAGYSIFTEGLAMKTDIAEVLARRVVRGWRNLRGLPGRKALLERWRKFVAHELTIVMKDLKKQRRDVG